MANELSINLFAKLVNGNLIEEFNPGQVQVTQATLGAHATVQEIGTSEETIGVGDVATLGYMFCRNLDGTNYVDIGPDSTGMVGFIRLKPGQIAMFPLKPGITIKGQANTAACKVKVLILEA